MREADIYSDTAPGEEDSLFGEKAPEDGAFVFVLKAFYRSRRLFVDLP